MKRNGLLLLGASTLAVLSAGCNNAVEMTPVTEEPYRPAPQYGATTAPGQRLADLDQPAHWSPENPYPVNGAYTAAPTTTYAEPAPTYASASYSDSSYAAPAMSATSGGGTTHTVQRGDTLFKLARMYYNDQSRWKAIFAANRDRLTSANDLRVGMDLLIP